MTEPRHAEPLPLGGRDGLPYSRGLMARALMAAGVSAVRAYELALRVGVDLAARGEDAVDLDRLEQLAVDVLGETEGSQAICRLRRYEALRELDLPIIVLIGGATGTGKSTVATEVAYRLGITRVTSTDFVRQTMRAFLTHDFMPSIHYSSFEVPPEEAGLGTVEGFVEQTRNVLIGVRGADRPRAARRAGRSCSRACTSCRACCLRSKARSSCSVSLQSRTPTSTRRTSGSGTPGRRACGRYRSTSTRIGDIRQLQDFILEQARAAGVPIVENGSIELSIGTVMELVLNGAERLAPV